MTDLEFAVALADEVRAALDAEHAIHAAAVDVLRREIAELRAQVRALTLTDTAPGRDGRDGRDGKDGITEERFAERLAAAVLELEDRAVERVANMIHIDGRDVKIGDRVLKRLPFIEYREVFQDGQNYRVGDAVTWGGHLWLCTAETTEKPAMTGSRFWKLAVKAGRDGRNGK